MRKIFGAVVLLSMVFAAWPAQAGYASKRVTFSADIPCALAGCTYWQPHEESPDTFALLPYLKGSPTTLFEPEEDAAFEKQSSYACTDPGIEGSYDDIVLKAPRGASSMRVDYRPEVDWDLWICAKPKRGNNGKMLGHEKVNYSDCSDPGAEADFGSVACASWVSAKVRGGTYVVVRAYNFSDPSDLSARVRWFG